MHCVSCSMQIRMPSKAPVDAMNKQYTRAAKDTDVVEGGLFGATVDGVPVLLVRLNGVVHAIGRICTHQDADLAEGSIEDGCVVCPLHGSKFDLTTGAALTLPAFEPEPVFDVYIEDCELYVSVPDDML